MTVAGAGGADDVGTLGIVPAAIAPPPFASPIPAGGGAPTVPAPRLLPFVAPGTERRPHPVTTGKSTAGFEETGAALEAARALESIAARLRTGSLRLPATATIADAPSALAAVAAALGAEQPTVDGAQRDGA